jgi:hypothetical protein
MLSYFFTPSLETYNAKIRKTAGISSQPLPSCFALWRTTHSSHSCSSTCTYTAILVETTCISTNPHIYRFNLLDSVKSYLESSLCIQSTQNRWFTGTKLNIIVQRPSTFQNENNKLYLTDVQYDNHYIQLPNSDERIPVFKLRDKCIILESRFIDIEKEEYKSYQYTMKAGMHLGFPSDPIEAMPLSLPTIPSSSSNIPQHIINGYIESLVLKSETCPVILDKLICTSTHITPCGHPISTEGLTWIHTKKNCPVCRTPCKTEKLYSWKL